MGQDTLRIIGTHSSNMVRELKGADIAQPLLSPFLVSTVLISSSNQFLVKRWLLGPVRCTDVCMSVCVYV